MAGRACDRCLARSWLLARLAANLEVVRSRLDALLSLASEDLIAAVAGRDAESVACELERFEAGGVRQRCAAAAVTAICRCDAGYPQPLRQLENPPSVLFVAGPPQRLPAMLANDPVAIVGARAASSYGLDLARALGRGLGAAGVTVVSGMALGIDSAAHAGALAVGGGSIAVLPASPERAYPPTRRAQHRQIVATGAVVSELPPGTGVWRWMFPARNRIIAGLAEVTVVVEATEHSGALLTAAMAERLGRVVAAVPGRVTSPLAAGPNRLLAAGARLIRGPQDVLDELFGQGLRTLRDTRPTLTEDQRTLLDAIAAGSDTPAALSRLDISTERWVADVAALELAGYVRRELGGRFAVIP